MANDTPIIDGIIVLKAGSHEGRKAVELRGLSDLNPSIILIENVLNPVGKLRFSKVARLLRFN